MKAVIVAPGHCREFYIEFQQVLANIPHSVYFQDNLSPKEFFWK